METPAGEVDFDGIHARVTANAMEALQEIFHRIPFDTEITLADGQKAVIRKFAEPGIKQREPGFEDHLHDTPSAGIDVKAADGSWHLEFILYLGGWGGAP